MVSLSTTVLRLDDKTFLCTQQCNATTSDMSVLLQTSPCVLLLFCRTEPVWDSFYFVKYLPTRSMGIKVKCHAPNATNRTAPPLLEATWYLLTDGHWSFYWRHRCDSRHTISLQKTHSMSNTSLQKWNWSAMTDSSRANKKVDQRASFSLQCTGLETDRDVFLFPWLPNVAKYFDNCKRQK